MIYVSGLIFNTLILIVLQWKADASVTNWLLKVLAVWDSLYLACQLGEWVVWQYVLGIRSVIKDVGYILVDLGCMLQDWYKFIEGSELCNMKNIWGKADVNMVDDKHA